MNRQTPASVHINSDVYTISVCLDACLIIGMLMSYADSFVFLPQQDRTQSSQTGLLWRRPIISVSVLQPPSPGTVHTVVRHMMSDTTPRAHMHDRRVIRKGSSSCLRLKHRHIIE